MPEAAVVNSSPLIVLARAGQLDLLRVVGESLVVPGAVAEEILAHSDEAARAVVGCAWLKRVADEPTSPAVAAWDLGAGESAVLSWAAARPGCLAVIDDYAARICALALGVSVVGTLGVVLRAKVRGRIPLARPVIEDLRRAGLYLSDTLIADVLSLAEE